MPLADAHRSGGWQWSTAKKRDYANDLAHLETLIVVDDGTNSSKSDKTPGSMAATEHSAYRCMYVIEWVSVKPAWKLTVTAAERSALGGILAAC